MQKPSLPFGKQISYAVGQLGWSTLINIIGLHQVYFYLPPAPKPGQDCFPDLIEKMAFWGLSTIGVVAAVGRLWDAFTDPLIANSSDRFFSRFGRRIPFLFLGGIPSAVFCWLIFVPPHNFVSSTNLVWMTSFMLLFYLFLTVYVTPFFALIPELGHTPEERLNLSTYISVTYALGIIVASTEPMIASVLQSSFVFDADPSLQTLVSRQYALGILCIFAAICMYFPVFTIHEKTYCESEASSVPFKEAILLTFKNKNFLYFALSDLCYFLALTILTTGISYYVTVLLELERDFVTQLLTVMLLVSFAFYPVVNFVARKIGKKRTVLIGFYLFLALFLSIFFIGKNSLPISPYIQGYMIVSVAAIPIAILGILPNAILADIAELDSLKTGSKREGLFYAGRTFMQKLGQTLAVLIFSSVILLGLDRDSKQQVSPNVTGIIAPSVADSKSELKKNNETEAKISKESSICKVEEVEAGGELGVRLTGPLASAFCLLAIFLFGKYKEDETLEEIAKIRGK
ncbi:MFS transporter [Leptospira biflexa]|uniref:MFS transporter n=1 Tax=Leptospira biflexa TaxID=172 RepID=UPI001F3B13FB|nr:MFS transporter [Leptospira biflexa]